MYDQENIVSTVREWVFKAENDFKDAQKVVRIARRVRSQARKLLPKRRSSRSGVDGFHILECLWNSSIMAMKLS